MAKKKCPACGKKIAKEATYCIYCRTWLEKSKEQKMRDAIVEETLATLMEDGYDSALQIAQTEEVKEYETSHVEEVVSQETTFVNSASEDLGIEEAQLEKLIDDEELNKAVALAENVQEAVVAEQTEESTAAKDAESSEDEFATRQIDTPTVAYSDEDKSDASLSHTMVMETAEEEEKPKRKFWRQALEEEQGKSGRSKVWLIVSLTAFLVIGFVFVSLVIRAARSAQDAPALKPSTATTVTRNVEHDAWLQTFVGEWVDENSRGKKDLQTLGGHRLYIHEIVGDTVIFDMYSYDSSAKEQTAHVMNMHAQLFDDVLHFTFENDACGHSGEGFMRLCEAGVETEILIDNAQDLAEDENSLAINSLFVRQELPHSDGVDLKELKTLDDVRAVAGEETEAVALNSTKKIEIHTFGAMIVKVHSDNRVHSISLDYSKIEDKTTYCYDQIDGTASYDTVKTYFGEAEHDYLEQPTDIRVLHYLSDEDSAVTFTFDSDSQLLLHILVDS